MNTTVQDRALVEAFLARAARLTPADWGKLDALGARLADGTPFALLDRAHADAAAYGLRRLLPEGAATGAALATRAALWAVTGVIGASMAVADPNGEKLQRWNAAQQQRMDMHMARHPERLLTRGYFRRLSEICRAQPGRDGVRHERRGAEQALTYGVFALLHHEDAPRDAFDAAYAFVEPVIPFRSLTLDQKLLPATTAG